MHRWTFWDLLTLAGSVASIIALFLALGEKTQPGLPGSLAVLIVVGGVLVLVSYIQARRVPLPRVGRDAMIDTGKRLIHGAKREVIIFGGDMSWANDYAEAIHTVVNRGKNVRVLYPKSGAPKPLQNAQILKRAGAELVATPIDSGLRAMLIDPEDQVDALLYVANRTLRTGAPPVEPGEHGSESNYKYLAKVYHIRRDWLLIRAATKIYEVLYKEGRKA